MASSTLLAVDSLPPFLMRVDGLVDFFACLFHRAFLVAGGQADARTSQQASRTRAISLSIFINVSCVDDAE